MPYKNKQKKSEYAKKYYVENRERIIQHSKEYGIKYRNRNRDKILQRVREYRRVNIDEINKRERERRLKQRIKTLIHYGGNPPKCNCCGETTLQFLCIDHINNDGVKHRKIIGNDHIAHWLIKNNFPDGYQVLCFNCNWAKSHGGCPHGMGGTRKPKAGV